MLPIDWDSVRYGHVGIMATIANQEEANRDIPKLLTLKFEREICWVGISIEPMLGPIDLTDIRFRDEDCDIKYDVLSGEAWVLNSDSPSRYSDDNPTLDWVIVGGESGKGSSIRTFELEHASALLDQCERAGVAVFFKQMGSKPTLAGKPIKFPHWKGENPDEWPAEFQIQQFPRALQ
jgi:protein gp37